MKKLLVLAGVAVAGSAFATDFFESEGANGNNNKANANAVGPMANGDNIRGFSTGTSTLTGNTNAFADTFLVSTATASLGIYQHRLTLTSAVVGHSGSLRGISQIAAPADTMAGAPWDGVVGTAGAATVDNSFQASSTATTPPRMNQWYGFGKGESAYYRVTGTAATTAEYFATHTVTQITPTNIGSYQAGNIVMNWNGQGHSTDTDMWVYDSNLSAISGYGNDDADAALSGAPVSVSSLQSYLNRSYAKGTYYIAVSNFSFDNEMCAASDDNFRTGTISDFTNIAMNSSTTTGLNMAFSISDGITTNVVANTKVGAYDVNWFTFTVVPEPGTFAALGAGLAILAARRRRK